MYQFVSTAITNYVNIFPSEQVDDIFNTVSTYGDGKKISLVYLSSISKLPIDLKYAAFKYINEIDFFCSKYGDLNKV